MIRIRTLLLITFLVSPCVCVAGPLEIQVAPGKLAVNAQSVTAKQILDALSARNVVKVTMDEGTALRARLTTVNARVSMREMGAALDIALAELPHQVVR